MPWMGRGGVGSNPKATGHTLFKGKMIILKNYPPVKSFFKKFKKCQKHFHLTSCESLKNKSFLNFDFILDFFVPDFKMRRGKQFL
ncbi:MAG: hypothetical protein AMJ90_01610 [candidate division Zixibacteria bacterium SM23_73_2]|nr:MAG: hypothetical protein AMJ90_01610 [candidate division Zixibacteria bacterium SM23_73_2]